MKTIISFDCETDGRIPGMHSMRQLGAVAFDLYGNEQSRFIRNLQPLKGAQTDPDTMKFWSEQPKEVWLRVTKSPGPPEEVICRFFDWMAKFDKPVLFAAPVMFDGFWLRFYMETFIGQSGFLLFHRALDARSVVWALTGRYTGDWKQWVRAVTQCSVKENPTPHYALTDALEQGELLFALMKWPKSKSKK